MPEPHCEQRRRPRRPASPSTLGLPRGDRAALPAGRLAARRRQGRDPGRRAAPSPGRWTTAEWAVDAHAPDDRRGRSSRACPAWPSAAARRAPPPRALGRHAATRTGWRGEEIPLEARIVAAADAYCAMLGAARLPRGADARRGARRAAGSGRRAARPARWSTRSRRAGAEDAGAAAARGLDGSAPALPHPCRWREVRDPRGAPARSCSSRSTAAPSSSPGRRSCAWTACAWPSRCPRGTAA